MKKREAIENRYQANRRTLPQYTGYIFSQRSKQVESLAYGKHGHIGGEGCGAVAVYNVMKFIGKEQDLCEVLHEMEELHMTWLGARFGTKPYALGRYFRKHGIPFNRYSSPNDFKAALLTGKIGIVNTWNKRLYGMHFYCVYYSIEENKHYTANYQSSSDFQPISLEEISNRRFIVGYVIR